MYIQWGIALSNLGVLAQLPKNHLPLLLFAPYLAKSQKNLHLEWSLMQFDVVLQ
jgi:hypothetical protein